MPEISGAISSSSYEYSNLTPDLSKESRINTPFKALYEKLGRKFNSKVSENNHFYKELWHNFQKEVPSLSCQDIESAIKNIFTKNEDKKTELMGRLVQSLALQNEASTQNSRGKAYWGETEQISLKNNQASTIHEWSNASLPPITTGLLNDKLFNEQLGIWNIENLPKVYVSMNTTAYFYPKNLTPKQKAPTAFSTSFNYELEPAKLLFNEKTLTRCKVDGIKQELVFANQFDIIGGQTPYGLNGDKQIENASSYKTISRKQYEQFDYIGTSYNSQTSFNHLWNAELDNVKSNFYCRVSFRLIDRKTGKKTYFSKYFKVDVLKNKHNHKDELITK